MDWTLLTGIIGAAAWIPPIIFGIRKWINKPFLTLTSARQCQIGFTELGPIFNIKFAVTADIESVLIDDITFELTHESGAKFNFRWHEVVELKGQMVVPGVSSHPIFQETEAIAIKVLPTDFLNIEIRSRLEKHTEGLRSYLYEFSKERRRLTNNNQYNADIFYATGTAQDMQEFMQSQMIWLAGGYDVLLRIRAKTPIKLETTKLRFDLSADDVGLLKNNSENIPSLVKNLCVANTSDSGNIQKTEWHWLDKKISKV